jgi:hypothetical protein
VVGVEVEVVVVVGGQVNHQKETKMEWFKVGATVMVHGINDDYVGRITAILPNRVVALEDASWVSESGRLANFVAKGSADGMEIEPVGRHIMAWEGITDWPHELFTKQI